MAANQQPVLVLPADAVHMENPAHMSQWKRMAAIIIPMYIMVMIGDLFAFPHNLVSGVSLLLIFTYKAQFFQCFVHVRHFVRRFWGGAAIIRILDAGAIPFFIGFLMIYELAIRPRIFGIYCPWTLYLGYQHTCQPLGPLYRN